MGSNLLLTTVSGSTGKKSMLNGEPVPEELGDTFPRDCPDFFNQLFLALYYCLPRRSECIGTDLGLHP